MLDIWKGNEIKKVAKLKKTQNIILRHQINWAVFFNKNSQMISSSHYLLSVSTFITPAGFACQTTNWGVKQAHPT
jgi:hypothetical protein